MVDANEKIRYSKDGYILIKNFFPEEEVEKIFIDVKYLFTKQLLAKGLWNQSTGNQDTFEKALYQLFLIDFDCFVNIGKQVQHLISLHQLSLSSKVIDTLKSLGLGFPNISTRPVLYFNQPKLAKEKVYHTVFPHQDWRSMQGSLDAVILWLPLIDINTSLGALEVIPGSHLWGLKTEKVEAGFGKVKLTKEDKSKMIPVEVKKGDALFFSSFLVHQSGQNITDNIRWSAHFRYNNMDEPTFIERKYAHPYIYKPIENLITENFPSRLQIEKIYNK